LIVYAGTTGLVDKLPVESLREFEVELYRFIDQNHPEIWKDIREKREIDEALKKSVDAALKTFLKRFVSSKEGGGEEAEEAKEKKSKKKASKDASDGKAKKREAEAEA
jgi:F-type H+-transporting ATPase subunit alpha